MGLFGGSEAVVDPAARDKYLLQVTAGPNYDPTSHSEVSVNSSDVHKVDNDLATSYLRVRIKDYHGLPKGAPETCSYFSHPLHSSDRYSVAWSFIPKRDVPGKDLVMGFDFSHPVRDRLPPGTKTAVKIATTVLDPGLYADPFSDEPYLYGPMLSSCFTLRVGAKDDEEGVQEQLKRLDEENEGVVEEGASLSGDSVRSSHSMPSSWKARRKFFLDQSQLESFTFEKGRLYHADFFNPHLDFSNFSLRLPGFSISVAKYVDEKTHHLRFVLKSRANGEVVFVVFFKLLFGQELEDTLKNGGQSANDTGEGQPQAPQAGAEAQPLQAAETGDAESRRKSTQREILGGSRAPSFQEPSGFKAPKPYTRDEESDSTLGSAANTFAQSISAAFAALGFGSWSATEGDNDSNAPPRIHGKPLDELDSNAVKEYLPEKNTGAR
ncbi:hypothetical protein E8E13_006975 [Curvularia kusanoi]|uniref:Domain of unknown function at the cortex 1 domain-containing protein n=1 Tax=Curvularia kusanoi TaxID=90978 RepID=A0A9P4W9U6_CURKU|nr:hypothetical protein E8E13_006975 [Curvularia kusanoi]